MYILHKHYLGAAVDYWAFYEQVVILCHSNPAALAIPVTPLPSYHPLYSGFSSLGDHYIVSYNGITHTCITENSQLGRDLLLVR